MTDLRTRMRESGAQIGIATDGDADRFGVVDSRGRVRGMQGLRVVDASIFPEIPSTPTNLTTIMLAERIAESLVSDYGGKERR